MSAQIIRNNPRPAHKLAVVKSLDKFTYFQRSRVGEFLSMVAERVPPGRHQVI